MPILYDFECPECGAQCERLTSTPESEICMEPENDSDRPCPGVLVQLLSPVRMNTIVRGNHDYAERERERLTRRSNEHWEKKGKQEGIERERLQLKKAGLL